MEHLPIPWLPGHECAGGWEVVEPAGMGEHDFVGCLEASAAAAVPLVLKLAWPPVSGVWLVVAETTGDRCCWRLQVLRLKVMCGGRLRRSVGPWTV